MIKAIEGEGRVGDSPWLAAGPGLPTGRLVVEPM